MTAETEGAVDTLCCSTSSVGSRPENEHTRVAMPPRSMHTPLLWASGVPGLFAECDVENGFRRQWHSVRSVRSASLCLPLVNSVRGALKRPIHSSLLFKTLCAQLPKENPRNIYKFLKEQMARVTGIDGWFLQADVDV